MEPLNLVMKKDCNNDDDKESVDSSVSSLNKIIDVKVDNTSPDMAIIKDTNDKKIDTSQINDQKLINALHISNLMQINNINLPNDITNTTSSSYNSQYYFMQLLAMIEAQQLMCQQMNWSMPQQFIRNPLRLPSQPYFDNTVTNNINNEQFLNTQNSTSIYSSLQSVKRDSSSDSKQSHSKR